MASNEDNFLGVTFIYNLYEYKKDLPLLKREVFWKQLIILIRFQMVSLKNETIAVELKPCDRLDKSKFIGLFACILTHIPDTRSLDKMSKTQTTVP